MKSRFAFLYTHTHTQYVQNDGKYENSHFAAMPLFLCYPFVLIFSFTHKVAWKEECLEWWIAEQRTTNIVQNTTKTKICHKLTYICTSNILSRSTQLVFVFVLVLVLTVYIGWSMNPYTIHSLTYSSHPLCAHDRNNILLCKRLKMKTEKKKGK